MSTEASTSANGDGNGHAAISDLMSRLVRDYTGRGPTTARTIIHDDVVTCVLADTLTRGEQQLVERGEVQNVLDTRTIFQNLMRAEAVEGVESILERKVIAFLSANHVEPDVAVETFLLDPEG